MAGPATARISRAKLDISTLAGLAVAFGAIIGGLHFEGGRIADVGQVTAAMIVLGGTIGAVMVTTPMPVLKSAIKKLSLVLRDPGNDCNALLEEILALSGKARRSGLVSIDQDVQGLPNPFLKKALMLAVDGVDLKEIRDIMECEIYADEKRGESEAKVFESAGGYAPTIGIIGAVLGLIQVMKHLEDIEAVGHGIAVAFVATVYGVAAANLVFLPVANKLKSRLQKSLDEKEFLLEGAISMAEGLHPNLIRNKLEAFMSETSEHPIELKRVRGKGRTTSAIQTAV